jgi:FtsZ-interacting cell division protein ZipA
VTSAFTFILAESGDDFGKILIGVIVFIVWGIGALVKMSKTSSEQARRRQEQLDAAIRAQVEAQRQREAAAAALGQRVGQPMPMPPVLQQQQGQRRQARLPVPPPPQMRQPQVAMRVPQQPRPQQPRKQQKRRVAPPQRPVMSTQALLEEIPAVVASEIGQGAVSASPARRLAAAAPMVRLTPQSIRQQFILAEILQPPLALRDRPTS